jgi:hypothetical protein
MVSSNRGSVVQGFRVAKIGVEAANLLHRDRFIDANAYF